MPISAWPVREAARATARSVHLVTEGEAPEADSGPIALSRDRDLPATRPGADGEHGIRSTRSDPELGIGAPRGILRPPCKARADA